MILLCSEGWGLGLLDPGKYPIARQFQHVAWDGFVVWELVMPCFMFFVGASLPFAIAKRETRGESFRKQLWHAVIRTLRLVLIGQLLWSYYAGRYSFDPIETLSQLALSYLACFLILRMSSVWQAATAAALLAVNWAVYVAFPGPDGAFSQTANVGLELDRVLFGITRGPDMNWNSLNFLGSTVTVLAGAWAANLLRSDRTPRQKVGLLAGLAALSFLACLALLPFIPIIHKCWTLSFAACHTGFALILLSAAYLLFDLGQYRKLALPFVVVGMNSIFIYVLNNSLKGGWLDRTVGIFTLEFRFLPYDIGPAIQGWAVFFLMWALCYSLYKRSIFIKV